MPMNANVFLDVADILGQYLKTTDEKLKISYIFSLMDCTSHSPKTNFRNGLIQIEETRELIAFIDYKEQRISFKIPFHTCSMLNFKSFKNIEETNSNLISNDLISNETQIRNFVKTMEEVGILCFIYK